ARKTRGGGRGGGSWSRFPGAAEEAPRALIDASHAATAGNPPENSMNSKVNDSPAATSTVTSSPQPPSHSVPNRRLNTRLRSGRSERIAARIDPDVTENWFEIESVSSAGATNVRSGAAPTGRAAGTRTNGFTSPRHSSERGFGSTLQSPGGGVHG